MKLWVLGSGSSGNAVLIESGESRVLVDAGFGTRTLATRLRAVGTGGRRGGGKWLPRHVVHGQTRRW